MTTEPAPTDLTRRPRDLVRELTGFVPEEVVAGHCADLLAGADPAAYGWLLPWLAGAPGARYPTGWAEHWPRVWAARGLLYVWADAASPAVAAGVRDPAWRVAEMCLKVARRHDLPVADDAVGLLDHELPRVRVAAARALATCGDTEHVTAVRSAGDADPDEAVRRAAARALHDLVRRLDLPGGVAGDDRRDGGSRGGSA